MKRIVISSYFLAMCLSIGEEECAAAQISSASAASNSSAEQSDAGANPFTTKEYQEWVKKFYAQNRLGKSLDEILRRMTVPDDSKLRYIKKMFGIDKVNVGGKEVETIDLSWPNMRRIFKKCLENEFSFRDREYGVRARKLLNLIKKTEWLSYGHFSLTAGQIKETIDLCLRGNKSLFVLKAVNQKLKQELKQKLAPKDLYACFEKHLKQMLKTYSGFQRLMSLLAVSILNSTGADSFVKDHNRIGVVEDNKDGNRYRLTGVHGRSIWLKEATFKKEEYDTTGWTARTSIFHEISHAYHDMLGLAIDGCEVPSILNSNGIDFLGLFFPMLARNEMDIAVEAIGQYIDRTIDKTIDETSFIDDMKNCMKSKDMGIIRNIFKVIIDCGFGGVFFSKENENLEIKNVTKDMLAKAIYVYSSAIHHKKSNDGSCAKDGYVNYPYKTIFTDAEEMLTITGLAPITDSSYNTYLIKDEQNEETHKTAHRENSGDEVWGSQFRFHCNLDKAGVANTIMSNINGIFIRKAAASIQDDTTMLIRAIPSFKPKTLRLSLASTEYNNKSIEYQNESTEKLHEAMYGEDNGAIVRLLNAKADPNAKNQTGKTPLGMAITLKKLDAMRILLEHGANPNAPNENGDTMLHMALESGNIGAVKVLLEHGANPNVPNKEGNSPLHCVYYKDDKNMVKFLLDSGADAGTLLHRAAKEGKKDMAKLLLPKSNVNARDRGGKAPLHFAAEMGCDKVADILLERPKINVNAKDAEGKTPLHFAAANGRDKVVLILLDKGKANVDRKDMEGKTPLHYAAVNGHSKVIELLFARKAIVKKDKNGKTPLHYAAIKGYGKVVELLLRGKANVHAKDNEEKRPLHYAAENGHSKVAELLLKNGANAHAKDKNGKTPIVLASESGHKNVVAIFARFLGKKTMEKTRGNKSKTPMWSASENKHKNIEGIAKELLPSKLDSPFSYR
ncbi:hypothetical protein FACS1894122_04320 [Alphaproteobacteria bacterium]|nr:hypothetical protein FACS1894122_04320 [Alphaproteobacteria bacterium]